LRQPKSRADGAGGGDGDDAAIAGGKAKRQRPRQRMPENADGPSGSRASIACAWRAQNSKSK